MERKILLTCLIASLLVIGIAAQASAITGRLGNSRMVLKMADGESVRRSISIENINDVPLTIETLASGDLADNLKVEENNFVLQPGEKKNLFFTITAKGSGTTETNLNVRFTQPGGGGVGLSATIIVIVGEDTSDDNSANVDDSSNVEEDGQNGTMIDSNENNSMRDGASSFNLSTMNILILSTIVLIGIFIALIAYSNKMRGKRSGRPRA